MRGLQGNEALQGLDSYEQMVNIFAENMKACWRLWGPLGEQMVRGIEAWEDLQQANLQWLQWLGEVSGAGEPSSPR